MYLIAKFKRRYVVAAGRGSSAIPKTARAKFGDDRNKRLQRVNDDFSCSGVT